MADETPSVFISHASDDIVRVREVRNYLEEKGALPILFHLIGTQNEEEFWPIILREIHARNFFLYCESPAAEASTWVARERQAVVTAAKEHPKRVGSVRVDRAVDHAAIDAFLEKLMVFVAYDDRDIAIARPIIADLLAGGFMVTDSGFPAENDQEYREALQKAMIEAGFLVIVRGTSSDRWLYSIVNSFVKVKHRRLEPLRSLVIVGDPSLESNGMSFVAPSNLRDELLRR